MAVPPLACAHPRCHVGDAIGGDDLNDVAEGFAQLTAARDLAFGAPVYCLGEAGSCPPSEPVCRL
eukprot:9545833-Alexandrium_andersonii.AAC.1